MTRFLFAELSGCYPLMLVAARLRHIAGTQWGRKRYMNMNRLRAVPANLNESAA